MSTDAGTPRFPKLKRVPAYRVVAEALVEEVLQRRLPPGSQLPSETDLAEQFGVNRSTVRESVRLMEDAGQQHPGPHKQPLITRPSTAAAPHHLPRELFRHGRKLHAMCVRLYDIQTVTPAPATAPYTTHEP